MTGVYGSKRPGCYPPPAVPPAILRAAIMAETARWIRGWAAGLFTLGGAPENVQHTMDGFDEGGGAGKPGDL
jgi:coenzyme F420-dependent glucose-6-phosphate dehydrogenase